MEAYALRPLISDMTATGTDIEHFTFKFLLLLSKAAPKKSSKISDNSEFIRPFTKMLDIDERIDNHASEIGNAQLTRFSVNWAI